MSDANNPKVTFHYIKAPYCVETPVHGAYGGINVGTGQLYMAVYSERTPIPQEIVAEVPIDGSAVDYRKAETKGKEGVIRTVNAVMHFDINTAISLNKWLSERIEAFRAANPDAFIMPLQEENK